jgi:hypothetical protein
MPHEPSPGIDRLVGWRKGGLVFWHNLLLIAISSALCASSQMKMFEIQYLELIYIFDLLLIMAWVLLRSEPVRIFRPFAAIGLRWAIFSLLVLALAGYGMKQDFFIEGGSALKQPFMLTVSRIVELFLDVFFMLLMASQMRDNPRLRRMGAMTYYLVGIAGALYAVGSLLLWLPTHHQVLAGAGENGRLTGFNNEGGSYGTYLLTVVFLTMVMRSEGWLSRRTAILSYILFAVTLMGTWSKAAMFEIAVFLLLAPVLRLRGLRLVLVTVATAAMIGFVFIAIDVPQLLSQYTDAIENYERLSVLRPNDANYTAGRVSGLYLAPKMIAEHPLVGIGLGNYPIVRDDPKYRHGTPLVHLTLDSPSLGPVDYMVDLGIPLFLYFTWVEIAPAIGFVRRNAGFGLTCLLFMQPVSNWFGAHLNLTYPWVAAAIALSIFYAAGRDTGANAMQLPPSNPSSKTEHTDSPVHAFPEPAR